MDCSDWVLIGTTLFLGIIAIWGDQIRSLIIGPRWSIKFKEVPPYCLKTSYKSLLDPTLDTPVYFFRFKVINSGRSLLKNCTAKIEQFWIFDVSNKPNKYPDWTEITLVWADDRKTLINLSPQNYEYSNIGHISSRKDQDRSELRKFDILGERDQGLCFFFETYSIPHSQPNFLSPGKYAIKVMLYAENLPAKELWFEITWSGKWQENVTEMFREITIYQIKSLE